MTCSRYNTFSGLHRGSCLGSGAPFIDFIRIKNFWCSVIVAFGALVDRLVGKLICLFMFAVGSGIATQSVNLSPDININDCFRSLHVGV